MASSRLCNHLDVIRSLQKIGWPHTQHLVKCVGAMRESGGSEEEVFAARDKTVGAQAAMDLLQLDKQRAAWQNRLSMFSDSLDLVLSAGMSETDQSAAIDALLLEQFEPSEQKRVIALLNDGRLE